MRLGRLYQTYDWILGLGPIIVLTFAIAIIYGISAVESTKLAGTQIVNAVIGVFLALVLTFVDYRSWKSISVSAYIAGILSLVSIFIFGESVFGARRWIDFGFFQFQPAETMKLILIIILARFFADNNKINLKEFINFLLISFTPIILVLVQPDFGSASVLLVISFGLLIFAGFSKKIIFSLIIISILCAPIGYQFLAPYQKQRIKTFLEPGTDPSGVGYNVLQSTIAVGSGGIWGRGLGQGSQSQLNFLPVAHSDFIFAGVAEATGFIGSVGLLLILGIIIWRAINIATLSQDRFGMFVALGIATMFLYQTTVNIAGNLGLLPIVGIPIPLVSFGGTTTITSLACIGILESIYLRHKKIRFG